MRLVTRFLSLAIVGMALAPAFGQSSSSAEMGSAGASGGVQGGSAAAGAQGAGLSGAASGGGPNLSPVVPSGSRSTTFGNAGQANAGNLNAMSQRPSTRQQFGNSANTRSNIQSADSTGLFSPGAQAFDQGGGGAVRPNRTYRSDIGAWQVVGPFQSGSSTNVFPNNGMVANGAAQYGAPNTGYYDANAYRGYYNGTPMQSFGGATNVAVPAATSSNETSIASPPRGVGLSNSLAPSPGNVNVGVGPDPGYDPTYTASAPPAARVRATLGLHMEGSFTGSGARVSRIAQGSAAWRAGLRRGDVITSLNGMGVYSHEDVLAAMQNVPADASTDVIVWRNGQSIPVTVHFTDIANGGRVAQSNFDPSRTSESSATEARLSRVEALMLQAQTELRQLRNDDTGR